MEPRRASLDERVQRECLRLEALEERIAPAGNVIVAVSGGNLTVTGDELGNDITITQGDPGVQSLLITPNDGTTIGGEAGALTVDGVTGSVTLKMGDGDDTVAFDGVLIAANASFDGGGGDDGLLLADCAIGGSVKAKGGDGEDVFALAGATMSVSGAVAIDGGAGGLGVNMTGHVGGNLATKGGTGTTGITLNNLTVDGSISIKGGNDYDVEEMTDLTVGRDVVIANGVGMATVSFTGSVGGKFSVANKCGAEFASVSLSSATIGSSLSIVNDKSPDASVTIDAATVDGTAKIANGYVVDIDDATFRKGLSISNGVASSATAITGGVVTGKFGLSNSGGGDLAAQTSVFVGAVTIANGKGNSDVAFTDCAVGVDQAVGKAYGVKIVSAGDVTSLAADVCTIGSLVSTHSGGAASIDVTDAYIVKDFAVTSKTTAGNSIDITSMEVGGRMTLNESGPNPFIYLTDVDVAGKTALSVTSPAAAGPGSYVALRNSHFGDALSVKAGAGNDEVDIYSTTIAEGDACWFEGPVKVTMGAGDDLLNVTDTGSDLASTFAAAVFADGGSGTNILLEGENTFESTTLAKNFV
jgi:hypothetical protein